MVVKGKESGGDISGDVGEGEGSISDREGEVVMEVGRG
jgi:hypothetical protein